MNAMNLTALLAKGSQTDVKSVRDWPGVLDGENPPVAALVKARLIENWL